MKKLSFTIIIFIIQCSSNNPNNPTMGQFILDTNAGEGGGIVFLREDDFLHFRVLIGERNDYYQIDIILNEYSIDTLIDFSLSGDNLSISKNRAEAIYPRFFRIRYECDALFSSPGIKMGGKDEKRMIE
ncbi:MAG: hypothetical protein JXA18_09440 [Chitinispirillaceae bacterium]|nr:hypothetical protein [Chitinispirillaceae bacterium]